MGMEITEDIQTALWSSKCVLKRPKSVCFCVTTCAKGSLEAQTSPSSIHVLGIVYQHGCHELSMTSLQAVIIIKYFVAVTATLQSTHAQIIIS